MFSKSEKKEVVHMVNDLPIMKTINQTAELFSLPAHFVRRMVLEGKVVYVRAGSKYLINTAKFAEFLNTGDCVSSSRSDAERDKPRGQIRRLY